SPVHGRLAIVLPAAHRWKPRDALPTGPAAASVLKTGWGRTDPSCMGRSSTSPAGNGAVPSVPFHPWRGVAMPALVALAATVAMLGLAAVNPPGALWTFPGIEAACALICLGRGVL